MTSDFAGSRLTIDLGALGRNWRTLADLSPASECAAVVKADAYGLGIPEAVPALSAAGAKTFFVAHLSEAREARAAAPDATVYALNGLPPGACDAFAKARIRPVLGSAAEIAEWAAFLSGSGADLPAAVHIDTGMRRLGLAPDEARSALPALPFAPALLMSHLSCGDEPDRPETEAQRALFAELRALVPGIPASLANSAGTLLGRTADGGDLGLDLRRPGVALYGSNPIDGRPSPLKSVVRIESRVIQVRDVPADAAVGYGGAERVRRRTKLAVISFGYADGIVRAGGSEDGRPGASAAIGGVLCPYVGRISMDLIAVDVTDVTPEVKRGDFVEVLGDTMGVDALAKACGTISYEMLTGLGRRYERRYV